MLRNSRTENSASRAPLSDLRLPGLVECLTVLCVVPTSPSSVAAKFEYRPLTSTFFVMSRDIVHMCPGTTFHVQLIGW